MIRHNNCCSTPDCVYCDEPIHGAYESYGGDLLHAECYKRFGNELAFIDRLNNCGTITRFRTCSDCGSFTSHTETNFPTCDLCEMPITHDDSFWCCGDVVTHAACKSDYLLIISTPITPDRPRLWQYVVLFFDGLIDLIYPKR